MAVQRTKAIFHQIAQRSQLFLSKFMSSSVKDNQLDQTRQELKVDDYKNMMIAQLEQSTRQDERINISVSNTNTEAHLSNIQATKDQDQGLSIQFKKRYQKIVYYNKQLQQEHVYNKDNFDVNQQRNNKRSRQIQGCEGLPNPNKKFIDNQRHIRNKQIKNYVQNSLFQQGKLHKYRKIVYPQSKEITTVMSDYNSTEMKYKYEKELRDQEQDIFPVKLIIRQIQNLTKPIINQNYVQQINIPQVGTYGLNYQKQDFLNMTDQQIKQVYRVIIRNKFGSVQFLQPINLYKKNIEQSILIEGKDLHIYEPQWKQKAFKLTFYNFDHYNSKTVIDKIRTKQLIFKYAAQVNSKMISFNESNGDLTLLQNYKNRRETQMIQRVK